MMLVYRIDHVSRQDNALTGIGAERYGGRWNAVGEKAVYCAAHRSLALLEVLAHVRQQSLFPIDRVMLSIALPTEELDVLDVSSLPKGWNDLTSYQFSASVFAKHCLANNKIGLKVPSAIVPEEFNVILNPLHADFAQVKVVDKKLIEWDERLLL